ncbi:thioesterase family protein [Amycolatopsis suaedae]|uniref:Thioesterase n=1 Tax=Amycolatopsis suaedae TaxID=2510978 RepID=A0A4Q7JA34_9PSEU|nr:thioesterase family protein [Amycolatopsis suaedae]RZQ63772.1 thioesterase [Amycolatopsis suaedae]
MAELSYRDTVREEWIDYNGHLSEPYYVLVFGDATTNLMEHTGLDAAYREATGCSLYTAEAHIRYLREVARGSELLVTTGVAALGARKVRLCHEMTVDGTLVATEELIAVHVGPDGAVPFPDEVTGRLRRFTIPVPDYAGRAIS